MKERANAVFHVHSGYSISDEEKTSHTPAPGTPSPENLNLRGNHRPLHSKPNGVKNSDVLNH